MNDMAAAAGSDLLGWSLLGLSFRWLLAAALLAGHTAIWLAAFNRINATGLSRPTIKKIEKSFVLAWFVILISMLAFEGGNMARFLFDSQPTATYASMSLIYFGLCGLAFVAMLPGWLIARWRLRENAIPHQTIARSKWDVAAHCSNSIYTSSLTRACAKIPWNEIGKLEWNCKKIPVAAPNAFVGLRIAHLSDLHLTGRMGADFYAFAFDLVMQHRPHLIIVTGDLVDYASQLPTLGELLPQLQAPSGCYFVLGNHDRRLPDPNDVRRLLTNHNWIDLGKGPHAMMHEGGLIELVGNETPWFGTRCLSWPFESTPAAKPLPRLKLAASHSPDQLAWAAKLKAHLLLAGHTHGGQVRLPVIGPIVAPSWHGSRYASGLFREKETLMHVSRGLSGVHPIRFRCLPEVSILELGPIQSLDRKERANNK